MLSGAKTATSSLAVEYPNPDDLPRVGERLVLTDHDGRKHGIVETTAVRTIPLGEVGDDVAHAEGEGFADAAAWRRDHLRFWAEITPLIRADIGDPEWEMGPDELVLVQWFRLVPEPAGTPPSQMV